MYSSEDVESFYFQYQSETLPHGESLQSFCLRNKVSHNVFYKWYKDTRKKIVAVQVDGAPAEENEESSMPVSLPSSSDTSDKPVRIWVEVRMSTGLHLSQKNLSYRELVRMIKKLEGLC